MAARTEIRVVPLAELRNFTDEFFANPGAQAIAPISRPRAEALVANPYAEPGDPALIIAQVEGRIVGYEGILPGVLNSGAGKTKVLWGSALYVDPEYRSRNVFLDIYRATLAFKKDFVITGFTDSVYSIYKALGFRELKPLPLCNLNISKQDFAASGLWLAKQRKTLHEAVYKAGDRLAPVFHWIAYRPLKAAYFANVKRAAKAALRGIEYREVAAVQESAETPVTRPHFARGVAGVNWMLRFPWVVERKRAEPGPSEPVFYFSDVRDSFQQHAFEFYDGGARPAGFLAFTVQSAEGKRTMKVTDYSVRGPDALQAAAWIAMLSAARYHVDFMEAAGGFKPALARTPWARFLVRDSMRRYLCRPVKGGALEKALDDLELQFADGDCPFT